MIIPELWKMGALASVVVMLGALIGWLFVARANLKADLAEQRARTLLCESVNAGWAAQADVISASTRAMHKEAEARQKKAVETLHQAEREAERHTLKAFDILKRQETGEECQAVKKLVGDYVRGRR